MWRWSWQHASLQNWLWVFSTYVEVILRRLFKGKTAICILHVCGGDPESSILTLCRSRYSPRMWRWSLTYLTGHVRGTVFSTYVEVIPNAGRQTFLQVGILHVCGGDPKSGWPLFSNLVYSPRMWRWSLTVLYLEHVITVFSTYVEVILKELKLLNLN